MSGQRGQAAVESALVLPLMTFLFLGIIQLTMIQQARLMTEYAAFQAARAGIVWNGNNERMHDAALIALLPTMGRTDDWPTLATAWTKEQTYDRALGALSWGYPPRTSLNGTNLLGLVRVDTVNPTYLTPMDYSLWKLPAGVNWKELDFDGPDTYPEVPNLESHVDKLYNLALPDSAEDSYRKSTLLQIRLRYWYEMKVPFANQVIFLSWFATNADVALWGAIERSTTRKQNMLGKSGDASSLRGQGRGIASQNGYATLVSTEMAILWQLSTGELPLIGGRRFFLPLSATQSMRMQSNFHRKWIMHL
jgi:hypothetical protein